MSVCLCCIKDPTPPKGSAKCSNMTGLSFQMSIRPGIPFFDRGQIWRKKIRLLAVLDTVLKGVCFYDRLLVRINLFI